MLSGTITVANIHLFVNLALKMLLMTTMLSTKIVMHVKDKVKLLERTNARELPQKF